MNKTLKSASDLDICNACQLGKSHHLPFQHVHSRSKVPFERIHANLWGSYPVVYTIRIKYFLIFVDDFIRYQWLYVLHKKL